MNVLVTGGTGFIGASLSAALARRGYQVRVLRRSSSSVEALAELPIEYVVGDLLDPETVARAVDGCDVVFHVAALVSYWRSKPDAIYRTNVEGTRLVMEACLRAGTTRVVHTSSVSAIGIPRQGAVGAEETPFDRRSAGFAYADSKRRAEEEVQRTIAKGLQGVIVNPATVIGAGDYRMAAGSVLVLAARGAMLALPPGGLCLVDLEAVVQGHIAAAEHGRVGERYILGGENLSIRQAAATVAEVVGRPAPRLVVPHWLLEPIALAVDAVNCVRRSPATVSGEQIRLSGLNHFYDSGKAVRELGYPLMPFRGAVEKAFHWYREHGHLS
jgi:dihydroflavonol-4-reductase